MITDDLKLVVDALSNGEIVAFPTETVYGLGARADREDAVIKIFEAKERPKDHPLISHCATKEKAFSVGKDIPDYAHALAEAFWPGPMTLIFKSNDDVQISSATRGGHSTVAVRVPSHSIALDMLEHCDFFVAAPSANKFGRVSPTKPEHVQDEFENVLILNGDQSQCGLESTIISCLGEKPEILRDGFISAIDIEALGIDVQITKANVAAPGTLEKHYSPSIKVVAVNNFTEVKDAQNSSIIALSKPDSEFKLISIHENTQDFAHNLYSFFRESEKVGVDTIYVLRPPMRDIGIAINDRVTKAANSGEKDE